MAKKNNKEENFSNSFFNFDFIKGLFRPVRILFDIHLKVAMNEFKKDTQRLLSGVVSLLFGCFFIFIFWLLLNVLGILALYEFLELKLFFCVLIVTGANLFFAIVMFLSAKQKMKKSFMQDTRKIIEETMEDLK